LEKEIFRLARILKEIGQPMEPIGGVRIMSVLSIFNGLKKTDIASIVDAGAIRLFSAAEVVFSKGDIYTLPPLAGDESPVYGGEAPAKGRTGNTYGIGTWNFFAQTTDSQG
jgi:hypothetical protein